MGGSFVLPSARGHDARVSASSGYHGAGRFLRSSLIFRGTLMVLSMLEAE